MTLLLYCRWWCGPSSSYLDQLTGCTLSVLVLVTAYHSGLHSALSPDNPWTETECGASQVRGEERVSGGGGRGEIVSRRTGRALAIQPVECDSVYTPGQLRAPPLPWSGHMCHVSPASGDPASERLITTRPKQWNNHIIGTAVLIYFSVPLNSIFHQRFQLE